MGQILYSLTVLQDTLSRMSKTSQTRTELEMAVIKLSNPSLDRSVDAILARLSKLENQLKSGMVSITSSAAQTAQVSVEKPSADTVNQTTQPVAAPGVTSTAPSVDIQPLPSPSKKEVSIFEEWPQVLDALRIPIMPCTVL